MLEETKSASGGEKEKAKFNLAKFLSITGVVILVAALTGAGVWYYMDQKNKAEEKTTESQETETKDTATEETTEAVDETANWKTYTDHDQRFTVKYPSDWSYQADVESGTDGSLNSNVFTADNVLFYDAGKTMVFGFNMGELFGRGGVCTKRQVLYGSTIAAKKLVLTKKGDTTKAVSTDEYCGVGEALTGYQATIEQFTEGGNEYFIHSEMVGASDAVSTEAIETFEKMAATMTFK